MKISVQGFQHSINKENLSKEMDYLIGKLQNNCIGRCRHRVRSSPYCVVKQLKTHAMNNNSPFISSPQHILPKCSKCLTRNCCCSLETSSKSAINDSVTLLKQLLREQTLIQEAVHRLQSRTSQREEFHFDHESPSRPCAAYNSDESESESDVEI